MFANGQLITPVMPPRESEAYDRLNDLAYDLVASASRLQGSAPHHVAKPLAGILTVLNCYYSNLIEGNATHPVDIERAMANDYFGDPVKRNLQLEAVAHIKTEKEMRARLEAEPDLNITSREFISWLHERFYSLLPEELRFVAKDDGTKIPVIPGRIRRENEPVKVGLHYAPMQPDLDACLRFFSEQYDFNTLTSKPGRVIAVACAHHRFVYIHPFLDGNGRVSRLLSIAMAIRAGIDAHGLWSISRGLARNNKRYKELLAAADALKHFANDGRGNLSLSALCNFSEFFLETAIDQINYMSGMLNIPDLANRIRAYVNLRAHSENPLHERSAVILTHVLATGACDRSTARSLTGLKDRAANEIIGQLLKEGLLRSENQRQPLTLGFPAKVLNHYFPNLYTDVLG